MNFDDKYKRQENIVVRNIAGETLLVPIRGDLADMERIFCLNDVGKFIWEHLNGGPSLNSIIKKMVDEYNVDEDICRRDMEELITDMLDAKLIINIV